MSEKVKLKGHESFSLREGWLSKGIYEVKNNQELFSCEDITDILGVGTNMVKSIKYWLQATGLIEESKKGKYQLTQLGELICFYDPYFEDTFSLYMIYLNLVSNKDKALIWNIFFNKCNAKTFSKKDLLEQIKYILDVTDKEYNEKILIDEINVLIKTFTIDEDKNDTPENNFTCPLTELKILKKISKDMYKKEKPDFDKLSPYVVYYALTKNMQEDYINIEDLLKEDDNISKMLNLDKSLVNEYLEIFKKQKLVTINRTAGLNMVYINKKYSLKEIFDLYFRREN